MRGGWIMLRPDSGSALYALVAGPPERGGGVGGWASTDRALRRPAKWYQGPPDDTYGWDLIFDLDQGGPSIDERLRVLYAMGKPVPGEDEPPRIKIDGDLWTPDKNVYWVIDNITLGERLWNPDGQLRQQRVKVDMSRGTLVDEIEAVRITKTRQGRKPRRRVVVVKANDTLRAVALRELGDGSRWKDLKAWNKKLKKVNPDARLRAGLHIAVR